METPAAPMATRYNNDKPELSYLLDFPRAFPLLVDSYVHEFYAPPVPGVMDDMRLIEWLLEFKTYGDVSILARCIRFHLLPELQNLINDDHPFDKMERIDTLGKLIAVFPDAFDDLCKVCANGTIKYDRDNWKKGFPTETLYECTMRHYRKYEAGITRDVIDQKMLDQWANDESLRAMFNDNVTDFEKRFETYHLSHVIWNIMVLIEQSK